MIPAALGQTTRKDDLMKDRYYFPAIFTEEERGVSIVFPDLPGCLPCADTLEEGIRSAKEALGLHLYGMEEDREEIPQPSALDTISVPDGSALCIIDVYMPMFRENMKRSVKKTLTIPAWLNAEAESHHINFSQLLQEALTERLGL